MSISQIPRNKSILLEKYTLLSDANTSPNGGFLWQATPAFFHLGFPYPRVMQPFCCQRSLGPAYVQGSPLPETHSKGVLCCAEAWFHLKMPSIHKWEWAADSKLGSSGLDCDLTNFRKDESGSCLLAKYTLLNEWTQAPIWVFSGKPP